MVTRIRGGIFHKMPFENWLPVEARISNHLDKYVDYDGKGGLKVFNGKRKFKWVCEKNQALLSNWKATIVRAMVKYAYHTETPLEVARSAEDKYYDDVYPYLQRIEGDITTLVEMLHSAGRKQTGPLNRMLRSLDDSENLLQKVMIEHYELEFSRKWEHDAARTEKEALGRLELDLDALFKRMTNLTVENQIEHIFNLLTHFKIKSSDDINYTDTLQRRLWRDRRIRTEARAMDLREKAEASKRQRLDDAIKKHGP